MIMILKYKIYRKYMKSIIIVNKMGIIRKEVVKIKNNWIIWIVIIKNSDYL